MSIKPKDMTEAIRRDEANKRMRAILRALEKRAKEEYEAREIVANARHVLGGESNTVFVSVPAPADPYDFMGVVDIARKHPRVREMRSPMVDLSSLFVEDWDGYEHIKDEDQSAWSEVDPRLRDDEDGSGALAIRFVDDYETLTEYDVSVELNGIFEAGVLHGVKMMAQILDAVAVDSSDEHLSFGARKILDAAGRLAKELLMADRPSYVTDAVLEEDEP